MRLLFLTHQFFPEHVGGTEVYGLGLAKRAQAQGHTVLVLTYIETAHWIRAFMKTDRIVYEGIEVTRIHYNLSVDQNPARAEYDNAFTKHEAAKEIDRFKPELVHCIHAMKLSASVLNLCTERNIPYLVSLVDFWFICPRHTLLKWDGTLCNGPQHRLYCVKCQHALHGFVDMPVMEIEDDQLIRTLEAGLASGEQKPPRVWSDVRAIAERNDTLKKVLEQAECIIALSEFQKKMFVHNGYDPGRIQVIRHGPETRHLEQRGPDRTLPLKLLFIGNIVPYKGLHIVLEALRGSANPHLHLLIYGNLPRKGDYPKTIRKLIEQDKRVRAMGEFSPDEMGPVFRSAFALLVPALWYENEPLVIKSALYCRVPVMASAIGSLTEMIKDGQTGQLLPPGDIEAWRAAFDSLREDSFPAGSGHYSLIDMDEHAAQIFDLYKRIVH